MEELYEDDATHPISFVDKLDVVLVSSAGVRLGIIVATPLKNDERSRLRLAQKFEVYVREFLVRREQWHSESGEPMGAWLYITIHPESDSEIFQLIEHYRSWVESNLITVVVSEPSK